MPDWWSAKSRPRPKVSVSVGGKAPSTFGMSALLDFDVKLTLDSKSLSRKEIDALLASTEGLVLIKGMWVEVDKEKLGQVLDQWRDVQRQAQAGGVSLGEPRQRVVDIAGVDQLADEIALHCGGQARTLVGRDAAARSQTAQEGAAGVRGAIEIESSHGSDVSFEPIRDPEALRVPVQDADVRRMVVLPLSSVGEQSLSSNHAYTYR